ncbi:hypothetical protein HWQ46_14225 [Shewanella sp. D64]|uniref:hypothetical protein n=1 Tax=unclassified Shewanella TaxID=196818 RepID=UPI0022BA6102|nr:MULTISPECIES: hypothetical protein [unclassified Shewanella]MEC4726706.1 hypothetical protein [Shewanella sp. D64]MEC4738930.1 hypothetical protein [Shewanella sp. E94]WBJ96917.1 hypothetical protein HWQ47_07330 [Shewanella sp. MTB7]
MMKHIINIILALGLVLFVVSCGGDDKDKGEKKVAYIQYYNASPDSTKTYLSLKKKKYSSINFGQSTSRYAVAVGDNKLSVTGNNSENKEVKFHEQDINLYNKDNHLYILAGNYAKTDFIDIKYNRDKLDEENKKKVNVDKKIIKMQVLAAHVSSGSQKFGIYIGKKVDGFGSAKYLSEIAYKGMTESEILTTGKYVVYLTEAGGNEPVFTTTEIDFKAKTVYKLLIRPAFGPSATGVKLDVVGHARTVPSFADINEKVQLRVYNGFEKNDKVEAKFNGKKGELHQQEVAKWGLSSFILTNFGDYDVTVSDVSTGNVLLNNLLVTYNQSDSKSILLYPDSTDKLKATVVGHKLTPRSYQYQLQLLNLASETKGLEVYFVRENETVETAKFKITKWNFTKNLKIWLPKGSYTVTVVKKGDNDTLNLLHRQELTLKDNLDYTLVLTPDETQTWGYRLMAFQ